MGCGTFGFFGWGNPQRIGTTRRHPVSRSNTITGSMLIFETLKQRKRRIFRAVPIPRSLLPMLIAYANGREGRIWPWGRTNGWKIVKAVMHKAGIVECLCKPKALRHAFAVEAGQKGIPLNIVQRWLGHARIETTAIYASAIGDEERNLARRSWSSLELAIPDRNDFRATGSMREV
jgi:integrase